MPQHISSLSTTNVKAVNQQGEGFMSLLRLGLGVGVGVGEAGSVGEGFDRKYLLISIYSGQLIAKIVVV